MLDRNGCSITPGAELLQSSSKNSDEPIETQCLNLLCRNRITGNEDNSGEQPTTNDPGTYRVADDDEIRGEGSILQNGRNLYIVYENRIWNRLGHRMMSPMESPHYKKVGQMLGLDFTVRTWFHEGMLELRR